MTTHERILSGLGFSAPKIIRRAARVWIDKDAEQFTEVDYEDTPWLAQWRWFLHHDQRGHAYVRRREGSQRKQTICTVFLHRAIMARVMPPPSPAHRYVDHINNDGLDNRRANLRWVTASENAKNIARYDSSIQIWVLRREAERASTVYDDFIPF